MLDTRVADAHGVDGGVRLSLEQGPIVIRFSDIAMQSSSDVNLFRDGRLVLHIKYLPIKGGFALNDRDGDAWRQEVFVECLRVPGRPRLTLLLALADDGGLTLVRPAMPPVPLGERFDLAGELLAVAPPSIEVARGADALEAERDDGHERHGVEILDRLRLREADGLAVGLDATVVCDSGFFIEGWVDDRRVRLAGIAMIDYTTGERAMLPFGRIRRPDVDAHLGAGQPGEFGFWAAGFGGMRQLDQAALSFVFEDGSGMPLELGPRINRGLGEFFELLLASFGQRAVIGNVTARSFADLNAGYGDFLGSLYRQYALQRRITVATAFGRKAGTPSVSLICVLYGIPDFLYLLIGQFARYGSLADLEFIFVNNSPELEDVLLRDAELASTVFDAEIKLISLNQNSGFSYANNVGVADARARTIAIINPDVFPRNAASVARLRALAASGTGRDIYGGKLYYADGSVMHEGMYFDKDRRLSALCRTPVWTVEHFRKGFPDTRPATAIKDAPAISGAFMVIDRALFKRLEGFNASFVFGHYEDADLCLRVRGAGGRVLVDPALAFWHYEGMGSVKRPEHVGSGFYNRWHFARLWGKRLEEAAHA